MAGPSANQPRLSPTSSPSGSYDLVLAPESPSEHRPSSRSRAASVKISDDISVASDITHLEIPRTPAHNRARQPSPASELPDHASEYYTAAWGSPYQFSPSLLSRSARTAVSEQEYSDRFTNSSPGPSFSLEHLIPSRFNDPPSPVTRPSLLDVPTAGPFEEDNDHTPRSRTKRWAEVPYKPLARDHWWGEGSDYNSQSRDPSISRASSRGRPRGHKTREENRTLDQQSFWNILQEEKVTDMAGLQASRWAATPSEDESPAKMSAMHDSKNPGYFDEKPLPAPPADDENAEEDTTQDQANSGAENTAAEPVAPEKRTEPPSIEVSENEHSKSESEQRNPADLAKPLPEPARLAPPKLRKRVSWRGKNCIISIPKLDYDALGLMKPMSNEEFQQRLKGFEDEGYDTSGFDISYVIPGDDMSMHAKPMWPDEAEMKQHMLDNKEHKVQLPNSKLWADYMEALTEARLAALGVSMGDDEPAPAPPSQDMSRQSSNQYPPLPFSPPLTTGSAASIGRPGMVRGHSHTMSMASPISPLNGPFGHMHRHSTFHGAFPGFVSPSQQAQDQPRQAPLPGLGNFSPITQSQLPRIGSPAQVTALRNELGGLRGPGSPLTNQVLPQSTSDYSRGMIDDQRRRQHGYSQSVQVPSMSRNFSPQTGRLSIGPQPVLPELPEDEDEEELSDPQPYVPPAKRQQSGHEIAIPTPRGHRHNISEGLEREVMEAEQRRQEDEVRPFGGFGQLGSQAPMTNGFHPQINDFKPAAEEEETPIEEKDPLSGDFVVAQAARGHRKTGTRANIIAPPAPTPPVAPPASSFRFNPSAEFQPGASSFSFRAEPAQEPIAPPSATSTTHSRQKSSGHFNPAAVTFEPGNSSTVPSSGFSFSASGPSFKVDAPAFQPTSTEVGSSDEGKIFGKVTIPEIVKPTKKSKAVPILQPSKANADSGTEVEDDEGRLKRGDERQKRQRAFGGSDGDEVPQFAEPTPTPVVPTQPADKFPVARSPEGSPKRSNKELEPEATEQNANKPVQAAAPSNYQKGHKKSSSSLSAMARPFVFHGPQSSLEQAKSPVKNTHVPQESISELEEGEIVEDEPAPAVPVHAANTHEEAPTDRDTTPSLSEPLRPYNLPDSVETSDEPRGEPTFDEIDAIMQQMNEVETVPNESPSKTISPPRSPDLQPPKGVTYIPGWPRSDAPSPSPKRQQLPYQNHNESSFTAHDRSDSGEQHQGMNGWPPQRLNKLDETAHSDWSGLLSPVDEDKLQQRSMFFDSHIDSVIGRVVDRRLQPLEVSLRAIQNTVTKRARSVDQQLTLKPRSSSIAESDADDEDDVNDSQRQRPVSRGRDFKLGQIKSIVLEAIREQAPASSQSYHDIADLHSALADMKVSFARAASASLELEDIRLIVEEAVNRQPKQIAPPAEDSQESLREVKEMKNRLDETLANALEDANNRQQAEAREADVRRMLKLAEEELRLLRESSQDDDARLHALEQERQELRQRAEAAEQAHEQAEERCQSMEAEHEAMQATLEEYRTSSHRWRQEIDENKSERDELESNVSELEQRLVAQQEAADQERQRLEKSLADLEQRAFAEHEAAQLEKAELANATVQAEQRLRAEQEANKRERTEFELRLQKDHESGKYMREEFEVRLQAEREAHNRVRDEFESRLQSAREAGNRMRDEFELRLQAELEGGKREREELENTIVGLERQFEETQDSGNGMRRRLEKLHSDMATAAGQLATEKASWRAREEDYIARCEVLEAQNNVHMRERATLEEEARELRAVAAESTDARLSLDHMRSSKASLDEMVRKQQAELKEQQALTARWERDYHDARESARAEIHRTRMSLETDVEAANHQVNIVRAEYESELARVRAELDSVRMDADTAKERHAIMLEAESDEKREALRKVNHDNSVALDKARTNYESAVEDLKAQHSRALRHAVEDKERSEYFLNERLTLADAKLQHFQDRVLHLEERLEVTKSAAQAAAMSAQGKNSPAPNARSTIPEKISPQALRESILVLQEQLQERETRIEQLQQKAKTEGPAKIKERDTEIAWLRELLGVRSEELTELINALSRPTFDRDTVRDTAIRIRANLQMEQREKERFGQSGSLPGQALASFTSFATPKATSLFNKWRNSMESNTLKSQQQSKSGSAAPSRSNTPSRPSVSARAPPSSFAGLMTPPATNLRSSPAPEATSSVPAPALSRATSRQEDEPAPSELSSKAQGKQPVTDVETEQDHPSTPPELFAANDYDHDAQDAPSQIPDFDDELEPDAEGDEDLDNVEDDQPPAFRSLEDELDEPESVTGAEEEGA